MSPHAIAIMEAVLRGTPTRRDIVPLYRRGIAADLPLNEWAHINQAIRDRWSVAGLNWIKREAWRAVPQEVTT